MGVNANAMLLYGVELELDQDLPWEYFEEYKEPGMNFDVFEREYSGHKFVFVKAFTAWDRHDHKVIEFPDQKALDEQMHEALCWLWSHGIKMISETPQWHLVSYYS